MGYNVNIAFMGGLGKLHHCSVPDNLKKGQFSGWAK